MSGQKDGTQIWIPVFEAFNRLRKAYEAADIYYNEEVCFEATVETLIRRMRSGQLESRASKFHLTDGWPDPDDPDSQTPKADSDGYYTVPALFWASFARCRAIYREQDWVAGDFAYRDQEAFGNAEGSVIGLELDERSLPFNTQAEIGSRSSEPKTGGRPPAKWWADFAEELAVYIHEHGLPDGKGHEGQSEVIDGVFAGMIERGKAEAGRPTIQPVVNAVLVRLRSAGK